MGAKGKSRKTADVQKRLVSEGWFVARKGPGDHLQYKHATKPGRVTVDAGAREIPTGSFARFTSKPDGNGEGQAECKQSH